MKTYLHFTKNVSSGIVKNKYIFDKINQTPKPFLLFTSRNAIKNCLQDGVLKVFLAVCILKSQHRIPVINTYISNFTSHLDINFEFSTKISTNKGYKELSKDKS